MSTHSKNNFQDFSKKNMIQSDFWPKKSVPMTWFFEKGFKNYQGSNSLSIIQSYNQ